MPMLPKVAVVGYPNVGKSTLLNRLTGRRDAVVHSEAGVTRDRKELQVDWIGRSFTLIDTGGVDTADRRQMARQIRAQVEAALKEAALVLLVVDGLTGIGPGDEDLAQIVRRSKRPAILVANKIDDFNRVDLIHEFHALGMGEPLPLSALHGTGSGDLLDMIVDRLEEMGEITEAESREEIRVAFIGKPNAGKSSMLNRMLGEERVIVSAEPGTTRDSIDTVVEAGDSLIRFVDTAGLRRPGKLSDDVEYYSRVRAFAALEKAQIALILVDCTVGLTDYDLTIIDEAMKRNCAAALLLNKWDLQKLDLEDLKWKLGRKTTLKPPFLATSALTGRGVKDILPLIRHLHELYTTHISTRELNKFLTEIKTEHSPPIVRGRQLKMYYVSQPAAAPPRIVVQVNNKGLVTRPYATYLENMMRERFGYFGCPLVIEFRGKKG
ncbi:MAG: ribosome biogenesis GTPase Der [Thermoleophilia bacterium]|nr:ribosome biogenesis GTPase Der [Thermoleophilia bacterium]